MRHAKPPPPNPYSHVKENVSCLEKVEVFDQERLVPFRCRAAHPQCLVSKRYPRAKTSGFSEKNVSIGHKKVINKPHGEFIQWKNPAGGP